MYDEPPYWEDCLAACSSRTYTQNTHHHHPSLF